MTLRWYHRLALPLVPALLLPFLAAPTCQGPVVGPREFGDDSIVIPMDECWQPYDQKDIEPATVPLGGAGSGCSGTYTKGALYGYGLVYYLIQNDVPVYWVINPAKTSVTGVDFSVPGATSQGNLYDWGQATATAAAHNGAALGVEAAGTNDWQCPAQGSCYRGGPFVIDGSDFQTVYNLLSSGGVFAQFANEIHLHVMHPSAPYTGNVAKTLEGTPPKIAILGVPGADCYDTAPILTQYLSDAALTGAAVFDVLYASDFNYTGGTLAGSNLKNYPLLWVPHWDVDDPDDWWSGPKADTCATGVVCSSTTGYACSDANTTSCVNNGYCATSMTKAQATNVMSVIGQYVAAGNNLFAECIGLGSMEGENDPAGTGNSPPLTDLSSTTLFQTKGGNLNASQNAAGAPIFDQVAASFLQIGDFPFKPATGYVGKFNPQNTGFLGTTNTLVSDNTGYDVLTEISSGTGAAGAGTVVYMGGHSYEQTQATQNVAGERMVLDTLFTLAAACTVPSPSSCNTGLLGPCATGTYQCQNGTLTCVETVFPVAETCNGIDDNCDGLIDNVPPQSCYNGPAGTQNCQGMAGPGYACGCTAGSEFCIGGAWSSCQGEVLPSAEICNGIDDACEGYIDSLPDGGPLAQACYNGPAGTEGVGLCVGGTEVCTAGAWSACNGEVLPAGGFCDGLDHECNGQPSECTACTLGQTQPCYTGPAGTLGVGLCKAGLEDCNDAGVWGSCTGEVTPQPDTCDGLDHECNGLPGNCPVCDAGATQPCYTGPTGTEGVGICQGGTETCQANSTWGQCLGETLPGTQYCNGQDDTCTGQVDQGAICPTTEACVNGNCVPASCGGGEFGTPCPAGYTCTAGACVAGACGDAGICPPGQTCQNNGCINPCKGVTCGTGSFCSDGTCVAGGCYSTGCDGGAFCSEGSCVANPCTGVDCPDGTFCRAGYCVQACAFVTCPAGQVCDINGNCNAPACDGGCTAGQTCQNGVCGTDPCIGVGCSQGQVCSGGICVDNPCNGVQCPGLIACVEGQCVDQERDGGTLGGSGGSSAGGTGSSAGGSSSSGGASTGAKGTSGGAGGTTGSGSSSTGGSSATGGTAGSGTGDGGGPVSEASGCHCGSAGGPGSLPTLLLGLGLFFGQRRRRKSKAPRAGRSPWKRTALALCTAALAAVSFSCSQTPPTATASSTGGSSSGGGGTTGGLGNGGGTSGGTTTTGGAGTTTGGNGGCTLCNGVCTDLATDKSNCGACGRSCPSTESCVLGACGDDNGVTPVLSSISPAVAAAGSASVALTLTGLRFVSGAQVLLEGDGFTSTTLPATLNAGGTLSATADFSTTGPGTVMVSVIDPGKLLSNSLPLQLATAGSPILTSMSPTSAPSGAPVALTFIGLNFVAATEIHVEGGSVPDTALTDTIMGTTSATATWDLSQITPGTYSFTAVNPGAASPTSNALTFVVTSTTPTLTSVTPNQGLSNGSPALDVVGTGFDASSIVQFGAAGQTPTSLPTTLISSTEVFASLSLTNVVPGAYQVTVQNAGPLTSQPLPFTVISSTPSIDQVTPDSAIAGSTPALNVLGQGFDPSSIAHFQNSSGGADVALTTTYVGAGSLTVPALSLVGVTAGTYQLVVVNSGPLTSAAFPFTVTTNTPSLSGVSPTGLAQSSAPAVVTLTGIDFETGATAQLIPLSTGTPATWPLTVASGGTSATTAAVNPAVLGVDDYEVTVTNPGGAVSNPGTFSISPGTPVLTTITPATAVTGTCASGTCAGTCTPPTMQLTGQYFTPTSVVHVTGLNGTAIVPSTYVSSTQLNSTPNLCGASPDTYTVAVWNSSTLISGNQSFVVTGP